MSVEVWITYILACMIVVIVPGPSVTIIIANSVKHGTKAGMANIAGGQLGLGLALIVLLAGLASVMSIVSEWFHILKIIGAVYLIWLGIKLWRSDGNLVAPEEKKIVGGFFLQGFFVSITNPKVLLFFGAFIPQFVNINVDPIYQLAILGLTFMVVASIIDGAYALLAGNAGKWLSTKRVRFVERFSGTLLVGGGLWLALSRR